MYSSSFDKFYVIIRCWTDIYGRLCFQIKLQWTVSLITCHWRLQDKKLFIFFCLEYTNSTAISCIGRVYHLFAPWGTTRHCFYHISPEAHAKMAGIVDKIYWRQVFSNTMSSYNNPNVENRDFTIDCILVRLSKLSLGNFDSKCSEI